MNEGEEDTPPTTPITSVKSIEPPVDANKLAVELRRAVVPKTHEFNFKSYDRCVIGSDVVDWITLRTWCESRNHALGVGQYLLEKHYFHHVVYEHGLRDGLYFYRYENPSEEKDGEGKPDDGRVEGSLFKLSSTFSAWNRRWFALDGSKLSYWASGKSKHGDAKASFDLNDAIVTRGLSQAESLTAERRNFVLAIKLRDADTYYLGGQILYICATSLADMTRWEIAFRRVTSGNELGEEEKTRRSMRRRRRSTKTKRRRVVRSHRLLSPQIRDRLNNLIRSSPSSSSSSSGNSNSNNNDTELKDVKRILEAMSSKDVEGFCNWYLEDYETRFKDSKSISGEIMESRFQWYDNFMSSCESSPICDMLPRTWRGNVVQTCMAKMFCATTRDHMNRLLLEKDETIMEIKDQNQDDRFRAIRDKIGALTMCLRFERRVQLEGAISVAFDGQLGSYVNQEIGVLKRGIKEATKQDVSVDMGGTNVFASMRLIFNLMEGSLTRVEKLNHAPTLVLLHQELEEILRSYADYLRKMVFAIEPSLPYYELPQLLDLARAKRVRTGLNDQRSSGRQMSTSPEHRSMLLSTSPSSNGSEGSSPMKSRCSPVKRNLKVEKDANQHMSRLCVILNTLNHLFANMPVLSERMSRGLEEEKSEGEDHVNLWRILKDYAPDRENAMNLLVFLVYWRFSGEFESRFRDNTKDWGVSDVDLENMNYSSWIEGLQAYLRNVIPSLRKRLVPKAYERFCLRFVTTFIARLWKMYFELDRIEGNGANAALRDFNELTRVLTDFAFVKGDEEDQDDDQVTKGRRSYLKSSIRNRVTREIQLLRICFKIVYMARKGTVGDRHKNQDYGKSIIHVFSTLWPDGTANDLQAILTLKGLARGEVSNMFGPLAVNMVIRRKTDVATRKNDEHCFECNRLRWTLTKHHCRNCGHRYCTWCITRKVDYVIGNKRKKKEWTCNACLMSTFLQMTYAKRGLKIRVTDLVPWQRNVSKENDGMAMMVSAGSRHTLFLRLDGKVLWCGRFKELPEEEEEEEEREMAKEDDNMIENLSSHEIEQKIERDVKHMRLGLVPVLVPGFRKSIRQISAGRSYSVFLDDNGTVYTFGLNSDGQLGHGNFDACNNKPRVVKALAGVSIVQIQASTSHTLFLDSSGTPWSCGRGEDGQLGFGHIVARCATPRRMQLIGNDRVVQCDAGAEFSVLLSKERRVMFSGSFLKNTDTPLNSLRPVALGDTIHGTERIVAGGYHVLIEARTQDYQSRVLYSFGRGDRGALGMGDLKHRTAPCLVEESRAYGVKYSAAGMHHTMMIGKDGFVFACGAGRSKRLTLMGRSNRRAIQVSAGESHFVLLNERGEVYVSGNSNHYGELGLGLEIESTKDLTRNTLVTSHMDRKEMELKVLQEIRRRVRAKYERKKKVEEDEEEKIEDSVMKNTTSSSSSKRQQHLRQNGTDGQCMCVGCVVM